MEMALAITTNPKQRPIHPYSTFRAVWIRGAGVKPLRGGVAPTPPVPNSCENRCSFRFVVISLVVKITGNRTFKTSSKLYQDLVAKVISTKENTYLVGADFAVN